MSPRGFVGLKAVSLDGIADSTSVYGTFFGKFGISFIVSVWFEVLQFL